MTSPELQAALDAIDAAFSGPRMTVNSVTVSASYWKLRAEHRADLEQQIQKLCAEAEGFFSFPVKLDGWWTSRGVTIP